MTNGKPTQGGGARAGDGDRLVHLGMRSDLPPRVRDLLEGLFKHAAGWFQPAVTRALTDIEDSLFRMAERSGNSGEQQRRFEALRAIKAGRAEVLARFERILESDLASVRQDQPFSKVPAKAAVPAKRSLELVDSDVLEVDLGLREIAGKADVRNSQALHLFTYRFAVIAGSAVPASEEVPLGPARLVDAFRQALQCIELDVEHRLLTFREFDRSVMLPLSPFYDRVNTWLGGQRVLPNLQLPSYRKTDARAADGTPAPADAPEADTPAAQQTEPGQPPARRGAGRPHASQSGPAGASPGPAAGAQHAGEHPISGPELFATLRELLGERRRIEEGGDDQGPTGGTQPASPEDLQNVLGALQRAPSTMAQQGRYDSEHFKNTLLVKLRRASEQGQTLGLGGEDRDTVDLIGMLFDYVTRNVRDNSASRSLLTRLHVPVLRVALNDKSFFTRPDHPARELMNTIAETGARWFDDTDTDPDLAQKMQMVVDHVSTDFDGDLAVFENLLGDLGKHMQLLARRAEVTERRHIDAARGRDRLEVAREAARGAVFQVLQKNVAAPRVRALLERTWTDALALAALREGPEGAEFKRRLGVAEELAQRGETPLAKTPTDERVRTDLEDGLRQVGLHGDDVGDLVDNLFTRAPTGEVAEKLKRIDDVLKEKPRLGGESAEKSAPVEPVAPLSPAEQEVLQRIKQTPFGTLFDFIRNQQGDVVRRKLAWFSPVTGHCLFVNQRGARTEDLTLNQLAREMARGQVRIAELESTSIIDRAWKAIADMLKLRGGRPLAATAGAMS